MRSCTLSLIVPIAAAVVGCSRPADPSASREDQIASYQQFADSYAQAYADGDLEGLMRLWGDDAVWQHLDLAAFKGQAAIRGYYTEDELFGGARLEIEPDEYVFGDDWRNVWGDYTLRWTDDAGEAQSAVGRFATLERRSPGGDWQMRRLLTSAAAPPPATAQTYTAGATSTDIVLENDRVIVQRLRFEPGGWVGEHPHAGNQLVIALEPTSIVYRSDGEEDSIELDRGQAYWVERTAAHDHKAESPGDLMLITLKR